MSEAYWLNIERELDEIRHGDVMERPILKTNREIFNYINQLESQVKALQEENKRLRDSSQLVIERYREVYGKGAFTVGPRTDFQEAMQQLYKVTQPTEG